MKKIISSTILSASMLLAANTSYNNEVTLLVGGVYTEGNLDLERNYPEAGLSLGVNVEDSFIDQVEIGFLNSIKKVDFTNSNDSTSVLRVFVNVIKDYPINSSSSIYALVGAGVEEFSTKNRNKNSLFGNYGIGYKYKLSDRTSLKFDLRHTIETDHGDNNLLYTAGLAFSFGEKASKPIIVKEEPKKVVQKKIMPVVLYDDDKDGVYNKNDKCLTTPKNAKVDMNGCIKSIELKINFKSDSDVMVKDYSNLLNAFANYLKDSDKKVIIAAYTDSRGKDSYNLKLSQKRAISIYNELIALDVKKDNLEAIGYGETNPVATNDTLEGRAENRRVKVIFTK